MFETDIPEGKKVVKPTKEAKVVRALYEEVKRVHIPDYRLAKNRAVKRFNKLAGWLQKYAIPPGAYISYVFELFEPQVYINMVCSKKSVQAFLDGYKRPDYEEQLNWDLQLFEKWENLNYSVDQIIDRIGEGASPLTMYCYIKSKGGDYSKFEEEAKIAWMFLDKEAQELYKNRFDSEVLNGLVGRQD